MEKNNSSIFLSQLLLHWQRSRRSFYAVMSVILLCLLAYNGASIFCTNVPFPAKVPPVPASFLPENVLENSLPEPSSTELSSVVRVSTTEDSPGATLSTHLPLLHKNASLVVISNRTTVYRHKRRKKHRRTPRNPGSEAARRFGMRVRKFFTSNASDASCKFRFFMTWISSVESFGDRELFSMQSLFKTHPDSCLIIVSNTLDSREGVQILRPFLDRGFKVTAISPDFKYLFKDTPAEAWYMQLVQGNVKPGAVSLGQNLSNLLRIGLLYRFGGIYLDTDIIVLKSFGELKNALGAQAFDPVAGNWSRLNNAVMIFDKGHPLLYKFIEEFALTFDGNRWGHNGPYMVSRVVSRVCGQPGYNFTVLPPMAFYPVDWTKIGSLFEGPKSLKHSKWLLAKLRQISSQSFAVHLWNKQSREFLVENGSIIQHIMFSSRVISNSFTSAVS